MTERTEPIKLLDVVALTENLPELGLRRGQVGTVVEDLAPGVYEVEFSDKKGRSAAILSLRAEQLILLNGQVKNRPAREAARQSSDRSSERPKGRALTAQALLQSGLAGLWKKRSDIGNSAAFARKLRERSQKRQWDD